MAVKQEFASRFAKHKDELEWLFMELYHNREGLEVLEREMAEAYNARSAENLLILGCRDPHRHEFASVTAGEYLL